MGSVPAISAAAATPAEIDWDGTRAPSIEAFEVLAQAAFDRLPEEFRALCSDVIFNVTEFPEDDVCKELEAESPFDILGLFTGIGLPQQGYAPQTYVDHIRQYGDRLKPGMWVGVGSVCKRNGDPEAIEEVLLAIKAERSDLRLHLFGVKTTALRSKLIRDMAYTADSMAWSFAARREGRDANCWREALAFADVIENMTPKFFPRQIRFDF